MIFRDARSIGSTNISEFNITAVQGNTKFVWDVSDLFNIVDQQITFSNGTVSFTTPTPELKTFVLFDNTMLLTPKSIGRIENQNLHSLPVTNYLIVTNPLFLSAANELAKIFIAVWRCIIR